MRVSEARGRVELQARAEAAVLADAAMQSGDPRGELLSLELAAANTRDPIRARRIHRAAQVVRDQHPELAWPRGPELDPLSLRTRAGFVIAAALPDAAYEGWIEHPASDQLRRVQVARSPSMPRLLDRLAARPHSLELLGLELVDSVELERLMPRIARVGAQGLRIGFTASAIEQLDAAKRVVSLARLGPLEQLRVLSLPGFLAPHSLARAPIEALDGWSRERDTLAAIAELPRLRTLCLRHDDELQPLAAAQRLEALALRGARVHELAVLAELPALHSLALADPSGRATAQLAGLARLVRLELREALPSRLDALRELSRLELLGLRGSLLEPGPLDLGPLAELPRLHTLILELGEHTPRGCDRLAGLRSLRVIGSVDLRWFAGTALDELTITEGISPRSLPRLSELGPLRRLRLPARVLHGIDGTTLARLLPELETLELSQASSPLVPEQFAAFPRLRRLVLDGIDRTRARFFAEELPEIAVETLAELDDPLDLAAAFDWRGVAWPKVNAKTGAT